MESFMPAAMYEREFLDKLYHDLYNGLIEKDRAELERVLMDGCVFVHADGLIQTKEEFIEAVMDGTLNYYSEMTQSISIIPLEMTAEILGRSRVGAALFGGPRQGIDLQLMCEMVRTSFGWRFRRIEASLY